MNNLRVMVKLYLIFYKIILWGWRIWQNPAHFISSPRPTLRKKKCPRWTRKAQAAGRHRRGPSCPRPTKVTEGESSTPSKTILPVVPNKRTNTVGQLWGHGGGAILGEAVISALNAHSWQSSCINEEMTPEYYHLVCCNSQQVEEGGGWDKHSSSDLYDQQMDDQDQWEGDI